MSWPLASLLLLALALAAGFGVYERSRPPARVLALVATLAAFAALGRIAFAPVPNVKPTTDIVLITGAALGGPAGWAVGAVSALASNVVFGQGPWTPWQMLAWGLCGLLGAGLARVGDGRLLERRVPLALACGAAGLVFGAILDFGTVSLGGGSDLGRRFLATDLGTSLPWNLAHALGNVAFALAFGPALLRSLARFRRRVTVTWRPVASAAPLVALALVALVPVALAASSRTYLTRAQHADGGWGSGPGSRSSALYTSWAALGLAAGGVNPRDARRGGTGRSALGYLERGATSLAATGDVERTLLVVGAAGANPHAFGGRDLVAALGRHRRKDGSFGGQVNLTAFGVFGLRIAGSPPGSAKLRAAARWLGRQQDHDGGWNFFRRGGASDADDTGAVLQALAAAGRGRSHAAVRGLGWLKRHQGLDGGFSQSGGGSSNAQSTAWAVQGIVALGRDPRRLHRGGARSPVAYLRSLRAPGGAVRYSRTSSQTPVWVTAQAELALHGRAFPLARVPRRRPPEHKSAAVARAVPAPPAPASHHRAPTAARKPARHPAPAPAPPSPAATSFARSAGVVAALILAPF